MPLGRLLSLAKAFPFLQSVTNPSAHAAERASESCLRKGRGTGGRGPRRRGEALRSPRAAPGGGAQDGRPSRPAALMLRPHC